MLGLTETLTISLEIAVLNESDTFNLVDSNTSANTISESAVADTAINGVLLQVLNEMDAPVSDVAWSLTESAGDLFAINAVSGVITLAQNDVLDYESNQRSISDPSERCCGIGKCHIDRNA